MSINSAQAAFVRKLESISRLSDEERHIAASIVGPMRDVPPHEDIVKDGSAPKSSTLIVKGLACRYKVLEDGQRQIMSYQVAGDIADLYSFVLKRMDHAIGAVSHVTVATITHEALASLIEKCPHLAKVLWRDTLIDSAVFRAWMINIGRRTAEQRFTHMVCEVYTRLKAVGLAGNNTFQFPVTQSDLGDSFGLSTVHVNRTLKKLREDGLLRFDRGVMSWDNWERLEAFSGFDPSYLHIDKTRGIPAMSMT